MIKLMADNVIIEYPGTKEYIQQNLSKRYHMTKENSIKKNMKILEQRKKKLRFIKFTVLCLCINNTIFFL